MLIFIFALIFDWKHNFINLSINLFNLNYLYEAD